MTERKKILLADDLDVFLEMERNFLQRDDLDLLIARNGNTALAMIREQAPQAAFLDLKMPGLSGLECCRRVKADAALSATAIVMVADAGRPEQVKACREAGCDELLFKPINHDEFLAMVGRYLDLEVRRGRRIKAKVRVYYGPQPQKLLSEFSVDMSMGGLYLRTDFPLPVDERLTIRFSLAEDHRLVSCQARVAWINEKENPRKPTLPPGMGVQFIDMSLKDVKSLKRFFDYNELEPSW
jgi:uncharacterized protein (TIGR02266 family)